MTFEQIPVVSDRGNCVAIRGKSSPYRERTAREMNDWKAEASLVDLRGNKKVIVLAKSEIRGKKR